MRFKWFYDRYGTRKGFLYSKWHQLQYYLGKYSCYDIPMENIERLVFVCKGNICRSAFGEAVAKSLGINTISAGIHAKIGAPANEQAIITAREMGYDLSTHKTTPIVYPILNETDLLIAMEPWQAEIIRYELGSEHHTTLLGLWMNPKRPLLVDPYGRSPEYFKNCFRYIEKSVHAIADKMK